VLAKPSQRPWEDRERERERDDFIARPRTTAPGSPGSGGRFEESASRLELHPPEEYLDRVSTKSNGRRPRIEGRGLRAEDWRLRMPRALASLRDGALVFWVHQRKPPAATDAGEGPPRCAQRLMKLGTRSDHDLAHLRRAGFVAPGGQSPPEGHTSQRRRPKDDVDESPTAFGRWVPRALTSRSDGRVVSPRDPSHEGRRSEGATVVNGAVQSEQVASARHEGGRRCGGSLWRNPRQSEQVAKQVASAQITLRALKPPPRPSNRRSDRCARRRPARYRRAGCRAACPARSAPRVLRPSRHLPPRGWADRRGCGGCRR